MITGKIDPRLRYQGCQSCNEIHRIEGHLGCSVSVRRLPVFAILLNDLDLDRLHVRNSRFNRGGILRQCASSDQCR